MASVVKSNMEIPENMDINPILKLLQHNKINVTNDLGACPKLFKRKLSGVMKTMHYINNEIALYTATYKI